MSKCFISFHNNPQAVFYGGQLLSGTAVLTTVKQKTIRAIHIEINGRAKVRWEESRSRTNSEGKSETYTEYYYGDEQYLASRSYVAGTSGGNSFEFMPGRYTYHFQVQLPMQLPSSIEGSYGNIRYEVRLTVDRPWRFDNVFQKMFTVIETLNLNFDPIYKQPIITEDIKEFCCGCCGDEHIKVICRIPFSGYAPGQKIPFSIRIENNSTVECYTSKIKLERTTRFTAHRPEHKSRYDTTYITDKQLGAVMKLSNKEFIDFLQIPPLPPSSVNSHHIIEVYYTMSVKSYTSGCHRNASLSFPIKIGTVPLAESATNPSSVITVQPTAPQKPLLDGDSPPPYFPNAPPSYENALDNLKTLADDDDKNIKKEPYVPKYPVYHNFAAPSAPEAGAVFPSAPSNLSDTPSTSASNDTSRLISNADGADPKKPQYGWKTQQ